MISFRPVTDDDYEYVYALNKQTMQAHAERTYGPWNETIARQIFAERWRPESMQIVVIDGQDGGMLEVIPIETGIWLANIRVAREHQGKGIGTRLVSEVLRDAHGRGLPVSLRVLKVNPARRLYERLGFVVVDENDTHHRMEARPPAP
jgi:GNAT superfamily N-acetyltransferase